MPSTVIQVRQMLAKSDDPVAACDTFARTLLSRASGGNVPYLAQAVNMLKTDLLEAADCRRNSDRLDMESFGKWFPTAAQPDAMFAWLQPDRDFVYNAHGLRLLRNRYLRPNEPIQYCMLRLAKLFAPTDDLRTLRLMYEVLSCGFMHTSSILADADQADSKIVPGEACRLLVANPNYNREFVNQVNEVCNLISLGVGVGMSATTVPLMGKTQNGQIRTGFRSFAKKLDSCNYLTIYERRPKIAIYIEMHNDTIYEAFELRNPLRTHLDNVFVGVMVSDYFIECYENDADWYLFPGDARLEGRTLCEFSGAEYARMYKRFVAAGLYSKVVHSAALLDDLVTCIAETGSPYVVWSDYVNRFSNHRHLGKIKTLNLCAEITNFASVEQSSSCTLMSINHATFRDFPDTLALVYAYVRELSTFDDATDDDDNGAAYCGLDEYAGDDVGSEMARYAYALGFIGTLALNNFMGTERKHRELGVSPLGVYDMALIGDVDPIKMIANVSEAMYKGCVHASCRFSRQHDVQCAYYSGSPFQQGVPQWLLRELPPSSDWTITRRLMTGGMANSQLTAQAPTATTSMLVGVAESVTLPMSVLMSRESENGRNDLLCYGLFYKLMAEPDADIDLANDIDRQILMYKRSAPFVDQSQSTMFSLVMSRQNILNLIMDTYHAQLKTSIYYTLPKQINNTLTIVRSAAAAESSPPDQSLKRSNTAADAANEDGPSSVQRRRPSCEACSA